MENKFSIVTGASTGIGKATAIEFGKSGSTVVLVARNKKKLEETKTLIEKAGGKAIVLETDLSDINSVNKLIISIKNVTNKINVIVNIAGIWHGDGEVYAGKEFETFEQKVIMDTLFVGIIAPTLLIHGLVDLMSPGSNIVNLSGTFENGAKGWSPYYISKRGIEDLTLGLSQDLKNNGINVNCISPSDTATEQYIKYFPEDAVDANTPEVIAKEIVGLISSNQTGQFIIVKNNKLIKEGFHK